MYVYIYSGIYIYIHMYIYIHTYIYTHTYSTIYMYIIRMYFLEGTTELSLWSHTVTSVVSLKRYGPSHTDPSKNGRQPAHNMNNRVFTRRAFLSKNVIFYLAQ